MRLKRGKKGIVWSEIAWWVIGLAVLAIVIVAVMIMRGRGTDLIEQIKNIFRFGK